MEYTIIADSCCDMTPELKTRLGLVTVPLTIKLGLKEFTDDESLDIDDFVNEMKECTGKLCSAAPTPFLYQEAVENSCDSFIITLSSKLSASYSNAVLGRQLAKENKKTSAHVFDSKSASAGEVLVAVKLRELLLQGLSKEHVIQTINQFIDNMKTYFVLEKYDNLLKNGRLNRITAKLISIMNIKLLMGSDGNGEITMYGKPRGVSQMIDKMLALIKDSGRQTEGESLVITHCNNPGLVEKLLAAISQQFNFKEILVVPTRGISSFYADEKGIVMAF